MKELHPDHCKALEDANLSPKANVPPSLDYMKKCFLRSNEVLERR
jgi:hypothetical protein